jgi:hypothetical protein
VNGFWLEHNANIQVDNTNEANLELYSIIGEVDNVGYPLAYCLLSTATAISLRKRTAALEAFLERVKITYDVKPSFTHVDKDFAEISALGTVWPDAKVRICWWHLRRAVQQRMAKGALKTSAYNAEAVRHEFPFTLITFAPTRPVDHHDDEGYGNRSDDEYQPKKKRKKKTKAPLTQPPPLLTPRELSQPNPNSLTIKIAIPASLTQSRTLPESTVSSDEDNNDEEGDTSSEEDMEQPEQLTKHEFCPVTLRDAAVSLLERHFCAHPSIPGYARPEPAAIRWWAVQEMYRFCFKNGLCEFWAYLWANWYRLERWNLWARSTCQDIPRLKTTMICESQ